MPVPSLETESSQSSSGYADGLGRRVLAFDRETGGILERLILRPELSAFEQALTDRLAIINGLEDERFARPRLVERQDERLTVVSEYVAGRRLSDIIESAAEHGIVAGLDAGLGLLLELLPALARLHDAGPSHGAVAPGRLMITPTAQIVLLDAIYAEPLERLQLTRKRLWAELRLAFPPTAGLARFDKPADLGHAAIVAATLTVGRELQDKDYPEGIPLLRHEIQEIASIRGSKSFADAVDKFFAATLPLAGRRTTPSADEAAIELRKLVRKELGINTCRTALLEFFQQIEAADAERNASEAAIHAQAVAAATERARRDVDRKQWQEPEPARGRGDQSRAQSERLERERAEAERERLEAERQERARVEAEQARRAERERAEQARLEAERVERERQEAERAARDRAEAERLERERIEAERREAERRERERAEQARLEAERIERERLEAERLEREREEARLEAERLERERIAQARLEAERRERERIEAERREAERLEAERLERERAEQARLEAERLERERLEAERLERERIEQARLEAERIEQARREAERLERERLEAERRERERLEAERLERERLERERLEAERRERERIARERAEKARLEAERLERERIEQARLEAERLERERIEKERAEKARLEAEKARIEAERKERERLERERIEKERAEKARLEAERQERERLEAERRERERIEAERKERERLEAERVERERAEAARREAEQRERERQEAERAARETAERVERERRQAEQARLEAERLEQQRLEAEQRAQQAAAEAEEDGEAESEETAPAAAGASPTPSRSGWLIPPNRAASFEPTGPEAPAPKPAARPYPIYVAPAEPAAWTAAAPVEKPADVFRAPAAEVRSAAPPPPAAIPLAPLIRLKGEDEVRVRAEVRREPVTPEPPAVDPYDRFEAPSEPRQIPWKLIAAGVGVILVAGGGFAAWRGYAPVAAPVVETVRSVIPKAASTELPPVAANVGRLIITTQPAGAKVTVDGKAAGETPLTIDGVKPGRHTIALIGPEGSTRRAIRVDGGQSLTLDVPLFSGFIAMSVPFVVTVSEAGKVLGTSENQILLGPGRHVLRLANKDLGYSETQTVEITSGETTRLDLDPMGRANINAAPWAAVFIDGEKAGETPLANVPIRLGVREIVFKNPQYPDRKQTVTIMAGAPATISVDFVK